MPCMWLPCSLFFVRTPCRRRAALACMHPQPCTTGVAFLASLPVPHSVIHLLTHLACGLLALGTVPWHASMGLLAHGGGDGAVGAAPGLPSLRCALPPSSCVTIEFLFALQGRGS